MQSILMSALIACLSGVADCEIRDQGEYQHVSVCDVLPPEKRETSGARPIYARFVMDGTKYFVAISPSCKES